MATQDDTRIFEELDALAHAYEVFFDVLNPEPGLYVHSPILLLEQLNKRFRGLLDQADNQGLLP